jgi:hypothetical protein
MAIIAWISAAAFAIGSLVLFRSPDRARLVGFLAVPYVVVLVAALFFGGETVVPSGAQILFWVAFAVNGVAAWREYLSQRRRSHEG